jgi:hypothetical protein
MIKIISLVFVTALAINAQAADKNDAKYFQISKVKMTEVADQYAQAPSLAQVIDFEDCHTTPNDSLPLDNAAPSLDPIDQVDIIIDKIINIGKKVWAVVETGRPVVNVQTYTANALPKGLKCWTDLSGWNAPRSKAYRVQYENAYGMTVVDFTYRVVFTAGGSLDGKGKYVTNATIMPANLDVSWGFTFNATAEVPSVFNTGSKEQPVAGMQLLIKWSVDTVMSHLEKTETFYISGNNTMRHLN